jgi:AAA domain-containing protein
MNGEDSMIEGHETVLLSALMNGTPELPVMAEDFASPPNRTIFECITGLKNRSLIAVCDALRRGRQLKNVGGAYRVTEIACLPHDADSLDYALDQVHEHSRRRRAAEIAKRLIEGKVTPTGAHRLLTKVIEQTQQIREPKRPLIEFRSPLQLKNFTPPPGHELVGDFHIVKGNVFVMGGAPGVGKSRGADSLAVAGATGHDWFGLSVHRQFKTMIVQAENGEFRLAREFAELDCEALEDFVRICPPPPYGFCFKREEFRTQLADAIAQFQPDIVIFDPWNAVAYEQDSREYLETFDALRSVLPLGDEAPALGIVAHTRKPKTDERASGRALLNLLAGSYVLGSVPRTVFVMQAASGDTTDNRVVWTCAKNNDGELGARSAWERRNGLFAPVIDFDWQMFDAPDCDRRQTITETDVAEVFADGPLSKTEAAKRLQENTGASKATAYRALDLNGRFRKHLRLEKGLWMWK